MLDFCPSLSFILALANKKLCVLKGTHARDFHSLFLTFFLHYSLTNRYLTQYNQHLKKNFFFTSFNHSPLLPKAGSGHHHQEREVKLSIVFETVHL
jgi:hypothetical protein